MTVLVLCISETTPSAILLLRDRFKGKGLWDYLDVFLVPFLSILSGLFIALLVWYLESGARRKEARLSIEREDSREEDRKEREHTRLEASKVQALQAFYDRVSDILINKQVITLAESARRLGSSYVDPVVESSRIIVRARTLSILREMKNDGEKKSSAIRFLVESKILSVLSVSLSGADLSLVNLLGIHLRRVDLFSANLFAANLGAADLSGSNLSLSNLQATVLTNANLCNAILIGSDLSRAKLYHVDLSGANLVGARLTEAKLLGAKLIAVDLRQADLSGTSLRNVNLKDIKWDDGTIWPESRKFEGAENIPASLIVQIGL